jgi:hypothetical protein
MIRVLTSILSLVLISCYFGSSHLDAVAVNSALHSNLSHAASHPGQEFSGFYQSLQVNAVTTSFKIRIFSMFVISITSYSSFCIEVVLIHDLGMHHFLL